MNKGDVLKIFQRKCASLFAKGIVGLAVVVGVIPLWSSQAFANPVPPPANNSYYVPYNATAATTNTWGCSQAQADASTGQNSLVVLDFGRQNASGTGTYTIGSNVFMSLSTEEALAEQFALGYQECGTHSQYLILAMGTSNYSNSTGSNLTYTNGVYWGQAVQAAINNIVSANYYNVTIDGAGDWESWGSFPNLSNWESGYVAATSAAIYDYGSADGCYQNYNSETTNLYCSAGWYQDNYVTASWGWSPALALPEIYYNGCNGSAVQDIQWGMISLRGVNNGTGRIDFSGPLGTNGTCESPGGAYIDLWNVINNTPSTAMTPYYLAVMN